MVRRNLKMFLLCWLHWTTQMSLVRNSRWESATKPLTRKPSRKAQTPTWRILQTSNATALGEEGKMATEEAKTATNAAKEVKTDNGANTAEETKTNANPDAIKETKTDSTPEETKRDTKPEETMPNDTNTEEAKPNPRPFKVSHKKLRQKN